MKTLFTKTRTIAALEAAKREYAKLIDLSAEYINSDKVYKTTDLRDLLYIVDDINFILSQCNPMVDVSNLRMFEPDIQTPLEQMESILNTSKVRISEITDLIDDIKYEEQYSSME